MEITQSVREDLVRYFVDQYPDSAAQILEQMDSNPAAQWLPQLPEKQAYALLERVLPGYTAVILEVLEQQFASNILSNLSHTTAAAVLRNTNAKDRRRLMDALAPGASRQLRALLNFSEESVGAWMQSDILVLPVDLSVGEALARITDQPDEKHSETLLVIDRDRHIRGTVHVASLLRAGSDLPLTEMMTRVYFAVPGRMSLKSAQHHEAWDSQQWVPVINRHRQFIGVLRHVDLHHGLEKLDEAERGSHSSEPSSAGILALYANTLVLMFNLISEIIFPASRGGKS